jgi:hypothetical protein
MSSPSLTFTPAMFAASRAGLKDTTRRLIRRDCFRSEDGRVKFLGDGELACPHKPGEIKPMVTPWAVPSIFDTLKPTALAAVLTPKFIWFDDGTEKPAWAGKSRPGRFLTKSLYPLAPQVEILTVHAELLLDITEESALREGIEEIGNGKYGVPNRAGDYEHQHVDATGSYCRLWDHINADRDNGKFAAVHNPPVWVITYRLL